MHRHNGTDYQHANDCPHCWREASDIQSEAIKSLRAQLAEKEREWKPIETAPKDNETEIILARGNRVTAGCWMEWEERCSEYHASTGVYLGESLQGGGAMWMSQDGGFTEEEPPTHWMPLPAPPRTGE